MLRTLPLIFSLLSSFVLLSATASAAPAGYYKVVPVAAPEAGKSVVKGLVWTCDGQACAATQGSSRPAIICAVAARELGPLTSFRAGAEEFDAEALAKCNAKAKPVAAEFAHAE